MQDEGRFTVAQITSNVSECVPLITGQYVFVLSIYHCNNFSCSFQDPSFIFVHQIYVRPEVNKPDIK